MNEEDPSRCSRKTALSIFFSFELFAFTFSLIALLSPSWQYVYLENGRTEHHHGLWLDCKRDYSHEYGRPREYYETLYRLDAQVSPFDQFFLPSLNCVYKFDYYIDTEDLYDHNHDENRLQDDANQHLFLPWKIATLAALGLAVLAAGTALLLSICAFCHRTFICASTVLVSIAALLSSVGLLVFYIWANYQDNNIIKEDDAVYQQYFGWAVYIQVAGTVLHFLASFLGCIATSIAFHKAKAKLVKIEVVDGDSSTLLDNDRSQQFKRSFSAIYKVDSAALRRWEREYMSKLKPKSASKEAHFKRAASMPNIKKGGKRWQQSTNISNVLSRSSTNISAASNSTNQTITTNSLSSAYQLNAPLPPKSALKPALKATAPIQSTSDDQDLTYEYLPCDTACYGKTSQPSESSSSYGARNGISLLTRNVLETTIGSQSMQETSINVYDKVYEQAAPQLTNGNLDFYEQPISIRARNSMSSFGDDAGGSQKVLRPISPLGDSTKSVDAVRQPPKSTLIDDVVSERPSTAVPSTTFDRWNADSPEFRTSSEVIKLRGHDLRMEEKRDLSRKLAAEYREVVKRPVVPPKPIPPPRQSPAAAEKNITEFAVHRNDSTHFTYGINQTQRPQEPDTISINTFNGGTLARKEGQRSITNLTLLPDDNGNVQAFERTDSNDLSSLNNFLLPKNHKQEPLVKKILTKTNDVRGARKQRNFIPDEVERSIGSSTMLENDTMTSPLPSTYLKEAELRLNLFMNGMAPIAVDFSNSSAVASSSASTKESSVITTV